MTQSKYEKLKKKFKTMHGIFELFCGNYINFQVANSEHVHSFFSNTYEAHTFLLIRDNFFKELVRTAALLVDKCNDRNDTCSLSSIKKLLEDPDVKELLRQDCIMENRGIHKSHAAFDETYTKFTARFDALFDEKKQLKPKEFQELKKVRDKFYMHKEYGYKIDFRTEYWKDIHKTLELIMEPLYELIENSPGFYNLPHFREIAEDFWKKFKTFHGLTDNQVRLIGLILEPYKDVITEVGLFGSRATGNYRPNSDIDVVLYGDIPPETVEEIHTKFEESTELPYKVDVVGYNTITNPALKQSIDTYSKPMLTKNSKRWHDELDYKDKMTHLYN